MALTYIRTKRLALIGACLLLACCCVPAVGQASETAKLTAAFTPYKLGASTTIKMHLSIGTTDGTVPFPVTSFVMHVPPALELIASSLGLATCQPSGLLADGLPGCSPNAQIGTGSATVAVPFGPQVVNEGAEITVFMGPPQPQDIGVLLYAESSTPVFAQLIFPGSVIIGAGPIGESLNTELPLTPTLPGAGDAAVTNMQLNIGPNHLTYYKSVHGRRVSYHPRGIAIPSTCPRGGFEFVADMTFQDGTALKVPATVPCPTAPRRRSRG